MGRQGVILEGSSRSPEGELAGGVELIDTDRGLGWKLVKKIGEEESVAMTPLSVDHVKSGDRQIEYIYEVQLEYFEGKQLVQTVRQIVENLTIRELPQESYEVSLDDSSQIHFPQSGVSIPKTIRR